MCLSLMVVKVEFSCAVLVVAFFGLIYFFYILPLLLYFWYHISSVFSDFIKTHTYIHMVFFFAHEEELPLKNVCTCAFLYCTRAPACRFSDGSNVQAHFLCILAFCSTYLICKFSQAHFYSCFGAHFKWPNSYFMLKL